MERCGMITATVEGDGMKRLEGLLAELSAWGEPYALIKPTKVLYQLSRMIGNAVLERSSTDLVARVKREMVPYAERAITGAGEGASARVARVLRRWAYRYIEELLVEVRDREGWGTVTNERTLALKAEPGPEQAGPGVPPESWGVRHTRPDWRRIQKGQASAGKHRPEQSEGEKKIRVYVGGREVS